MPARIVLVGRPNSGKTSLYNCLTGGQAHVGNFPGTTVDISETELILTNGSVVTVVDLPGLYSIEVQLDPLTDEGIASTFLKRLQDELHPSRNLIVQTLDATHLALGLQLTHELLRDQFNLLLIATQADILDAQGRTLDVDALEAKLGVPVLLVNTRAASTRVQTLHAIEKVFSKKENLTLPPPEWDPYEVACSVVSDASSLSLAVQRKRTFTNRLDRVLLHPLLGPFLFLGILALLFAAVFLVSDPVVHLIDQAIHKFSIFLTDQLGEGRLVSFLVEGVLGGAGAVFSFLPQIVVLTLGMEILEATGYLARGAFLLDRLLRLFGLSGRSFLPLLMGHACAIPAITATRIVRNPHERLVLILIIPLMSCSARLPTYALVLSTFFANYGPWFKAITFVGLYFVGILGGLIATFWLRRTVARGPNLPLVLEMPAYRTPSLSWIGRKARQTAYSFAHEIGTKIVAASALLWLLLTLPCPQFLSHQNESVSGRSAQLETSIAGEIGHFLEPITQPIGFDWRINVGLLSAFGQREVMVSTMGIIFGLQDGDPLRSSIPERIRTTKNTDGQLLYSMRTGLALLAFFVFACQCMSTLLAIHRETRTWRWPLFVFGYTYGAAYMAAWIVYRLAGLFNG